jgi:hypothetical protein
MPFPAPSPSVEESSGRPLFTFSSETASLIKFLTVANIAKSNAADVGNNIKESLDELSIIMDGEESGIPVEHLDCDKDEDEHCDEHEISVKGAALLSNRKSDKCMTDEMECSMGDMAESLEEYQMELVSMATDDKNICRNCSKVIKSEKSVLSGQSMCTCVNKGNGNIGSRDKLTERPSVLELGACCSKSLKNPTATETGTKQIEKNLILVTGEFAVALHQIGFKNVPPYSKESILASGATPMDSDNPEGFMVVNYSNNDIHIVHRQQKLDTPDHLIDLFGHVTGLCLTPDQRLASFVTRFS